MLIAPALPGAITKRLIGETTNEAAKAMPPRAGKAAAANKMAAVALNYGERFRIAGRQNVNVPAA